jgi:hypothetical protein
MPESLKSENLGEYPEVLGMAAQSEDGSIQMMISSHHDDWDADVPCTVEFMRRTPSVW